MSFSFGFSGDDIDADQNGASHQTAPTPAASAAPPPNQAFPVPGKPQLPATSHPLSDLLASLPSRISYSLLDVSLDGATTIQLPRRELWDVRVQIMAEDDELTAEGREELVDDGGLGRHDVKTGIYEGGFKSWESSVDLVKVLAARDHLSAADPDESSGLRVIELGCGTGLPSLALFQWIMTMDKSSRPRKRPFRLVLADYNPSVLRLVTLPNLLLSWALSHASSASTAPSLSDAFSMDGEFEITPAIVAAFQHFLAESGIHLTFLSGAWSPQFLDLLYASPAFAGAGDPGSESGSGSQTNACSTLIMGAETIYSPFALQAFTEVLFAIMEREKGAAAAPVEAYVAAKMLYFGVGGSLTDFVDGARARGALVTELSEETEGVRRGVVSCVLPE